MVLCVCFFLPPFILDIKFVGRTSRGHTGGRSHKISHPPSFCGACLHFSREKIQPFLSFVDREVEFLCTNVLIVLHSLGIIFQFLVRKFRLRGLNSRHNVSEGYEVTSELPGRPDSYILMPIVYG